MSLTQDQSADPSGSPAQPLAEREQVPLSGTNGGKPPRVKKPRSRRRRIFYRVLLAIFAFLLVVVSWASWSLYRATQSSEGEPTEVIAATWARDHHLGFVVAKAEDFYYRYIDTTPVGGEPTEAAAIDAGSDDGVASGTASDGTSTETGTTPTGAVLEHLQPPATMKSPAGKNLPDEGVWQATKSTVDGTPAIYVARVRPDGIHTSVFASLMWIDTKLAKFGFVPGYQEPGGSSPTGGAMPKSWVPDALASFNGGFRLQDSQGGYYNAGQTVAPLRDGAASAVIYKDGRMKIGKWNRDVTMSKDVQTVRQNLNLIVDKGRSQINGSGGSEWGATTDGASLAWRSAVGQRSDGSVVYIGSPSLSADALANTLVEAGVRRAMTLDMNNWWVAGFYYRKTPNGDLACKKLDPAIQEGCDRFLNKYKRDNFAVLAK